MLEAVAGAQRLAFTLLRDVSGDAELYLSEIDSSNKRFTVSFDYAVGGTPLRFSDGSHAATVTIEGQTITEFSLHCRSYTLSDSPALLLPIRQPRPSRAANIWVPSCTSATTSTARTPSASAGLPTDLSGKDART